MIDSRITPTAPTGYSPAFARVLAALEGCPRHWAPERAPRAGCPICEPEARAALAALRREVLR